VMAVVTSLKLRLLAYQFGNTFVFVMVMVKSMSISPIGIGKQTPRCLFRRRRFQEGIIPP